MPTGKHTSSQDRPQALRVERLKGNIFEVQVCINIDTSQKDDAGNTVFNYTQYMQVVKAENYRDLLYQIISTRYDCDKNMVFQEQFNAYQYNQMTAFVAAAKEAAVQFYPNDGTDVPYNVNLKVVKELIESADDVSNMDLEAARQYYIALSKANLELWLEANPMPSDVHGGVVKLYTVTAQKQAQLNSIVTTIMLAQMSGQSFTPTWNSTGETCEDWTAEEILALSAQVYAYVKPQVSKQQYLEVQLKSCTTKEEMAAIKLEYGGDDVG